MTVNTTTARTLLLHTNRPKPGPARADGPSRHRSALTPSATNEVR